jgi:hypothetical protein
MRKRLFAICLVLVLLVAATGLSCEPTEKGTIEVKATIDGSPWTGAVDYTLTRTGETLNGASVDKTFSVAPDTWTCAYVSGGPGLFVDITTSDTQSVAAGATITFTLNFETPQQVDAFIVFETWTINGTPVKGDFHFVGPGTVIDARYKEGVSGAPNQTCQEVKVKETLMTKYHWQGNEGQPADPKSLHVVNAWGAVWGVPPFEQKLSQIATFNGQPVAACTRVSCPHCDPQTLDVEIETVQHVGTNYTKNVNWIRFKPPQGGLQILQGGLDEVLFEDDNLPFQNGEMFTLTTWACIELDEPGFEDSNPGNDCCPMSNNITIMYWEGPLP